MDLAELKFVVDTKELETAATRVAELGTAVSKLNKPMQDLTKESAKTNKELSKAEEAAAKAATAQLKLEQAQTKSTQAAAKSSSVLERQNLILEYMAQGNSKGQASILATAKAAGALDDEMLELNKTLVTQRTLIGGDPFDKSIGLMQKLQNEYKTTNEVTNLFNKNLGLTQKQMIDLAREKERLIALYGVEGKSLDNLAAEYDQLIQKSAMINKANDARTKSMRDQVKAQDDAAKANAYLASELDRVNRLTEAGGNVTSAVNNKLIKFEQALKQSGQTAAQQVVALEKYKASLLSIQKAGGNRQIDYLSRALGPQITDIGVGLMTGQAPLTILLQQGGQLRDQFALAGVAGSEMGKMLVQASKAMVVSIKDIGLAVGQLVTGAIAGTGKAIVSGIISPFKRLSEGREALKQLEDGLISNLRYTRLLEVANGRLTQSVIAMGKVAATVAVIGVAMLAKGLYDVIKQQDQLTTQLVLTGASLGVNTAQATSYANSLNAVGVTTNSALKVIAAMAKEGGFLAKEITMVVTAANNLKFAGVAIEDTVKQFAKLKEKPVEALVEIARATGLVKPEVIALVSELEQQGKTSQAAAIAMKAYADVTVAQKDRLKQELSGFAIFMKTLSSSIGEFFDEVFRGLWRKASPTEAIKREIKELENTIKIGTQASPQTKARNEATHLALKEQLRLSQLASDAETTRSSDNIRAAKALGEWQQLSITNLDKEKKAELDIANIRKVGLEAKKSEAEIEKLIAAYKEKNKPPKTPKTDEEKERLRLLKESEKYLSRISSLNNTAIKEQEEYTKAQKLALDIFSDPDFKNYPEQQRIKITKAIEQAHAEELVANELTKQRAVQKKIYDEYIQLQAKRDDAMDAAIGNSIDLNKVVKEESDELMLQAGLIGLTDQERKKAIKTRQAELLLARELAAIDKLKSLDNGQDIAELQAQAYQRFADRTKNINTEIANDFVEKQLAEYNRISDGLTDAVVTGLIEGGKAGRTKLRDLIVAELMKPIRIVIDAVINTTLGSFIQSAIGGSAGSSFAGSATGSAATGGISGMSIGGATLGAQAGAFGQGVASGFSFGAPVSSMGTATSGAFNAGATYGAPVAGVLAGVYGGRAVSGGYSAMGGASGNSAVNVGTAIGLAIAGPLGAALGGLAGGAFNRTFGRKLTEVGIRGTLGGETGFEGERYTFEKGGILRSNKTRPSLLEEAERSAIASDFRLIKGEVIELAQSAGFGSDALKDFTAKFNINLKGLSPEEATKKYQEEFAKIEESMAKAVIGTSGYRRENETNIQALVRISSFMSGLNKAFEILGFDTYNLELASLDAAQAFVDLFGGIENLNKAMGFFYDNFFTQEERTTRATENLKEEFNKLNKEMPQTREEFKQMVIAAQKAGDTQLVKNLTDLQYAFAELIPTTEDLAEAARKAAEDATKAAEETAKALKKLFEDNTDAAYSALQRSVNARKKEIDENIEANKAEIDSLNLRKNAIESSVKILQDLFEILKRNTKELYQQVDAVSAVSVRASRDFISQALKTAVSTGVLPDNKEISDAISIVRTDIDKNQFRTKADADRQRLLLANDLAELQLLTEKQISTEERMLIGIESQISLLKAQNEILDSQKNNLDQMLVSFKEQIDAIRGVDTSIKSLSDAISNMSSAIRQEAANKNVPVPSSSSSSAGTPTGQSGYRLEGNTLYFPGGGSHTVAGVDGAKLLTETYGLVPSGTGGLIRTRAQGGYTPSGMTLVGEEGPELVNFSRPGMVYTAAQTQSLMQGSSSDELKAIREELIMLRAEVRADVSHNAKTAKLLDRVIPDGQSIQVTTVTA